MPDTNRQFEQAHLQNLKSDQEEVERVYLSTIDQIFQVVAITAFTLEIFRLSDYPVLKTRLEEILTRHKVRVQAIMERGIRREWLMSETKNEAVLNAAYGEVAQPVLDKLRTDPELLEDFIQRPKNRIRLSARVWRLTHQLQAGIEGTLFAGIQEGLPAAKMATQMKQYLNEPDRLFRRVRNAKGRLVLSENAKKYKPGRGVYRSSYKNALRLTAHQTNSSYRTSDHERWKRTEFVLGQRIQLSKNHPTNVEPIRCDLLVGDYGTEYKFTGFHLQCLCFSTPILPSIEEFKEYEQSVLNGTDTNFKFKGVVKGMPERSKNWVIANQETFEGWANPPLFMQDNSAIINKVLAE